MAVALGITLHAISFVANDMSQGVQYNMRHRLTGVYEALLVAKAESDWSLQLSNFEAVHARASVCEHIRGLHVKLTPNIRCQVMSMPQTQELFSLAQAGA